jgi:hypothetical protein
LTGQSWLPSSIGSEVSKNQQPNAKHARDLGDNIEAGREDGYQLRDAIRGIMEGGEAAFNLRNERNGL